MSSDVSPQRREYVLTVLCGVLGLSVARGQDHLLSFLDGHDDVKQHVDEVASLCAGPLNAFTADELEVAGKLKAHDDPAESSVLSSEAWKYIVTLADSKNESWDAIKALADYNIKCNKITTAFQTHASRSLSTSNKLSTISASRQKLLKEETATLALACAEMDAEAERLESYYETIANNNFIHKSLVHNATSNLNFNNPEDEYKQFDLQRRVRQIYNETISPHDHILTKLQALGWELNYDNTKNDELVSEARRFASEIVWSLFQKCQMSLDAVYAEACSSGRDALKDASYTKAVEDERHEIGQEIKSLWDEVVPVAHMAVEKEFVKPLLMTTNIDSREKQLRNTTISAYTSGVLRFMNQHLQALADRIHVLILHHKALFDAYHYASARCKGNSALDLPKSTAHDSSIETSDGPAQSTFNDMVKHYLTKFGSIPINVGRGHPARSPNEETATKLQQFVTSRNGKLSMMYEQLQDMFEAAAKANLGNVEIGRAILSRRLAADGNAGLDLPGLSVHRDAEAEEAIRLMENEVRVVRERFADLDESAASSAPDFIMQAAARVQRRLASKRCEGCAAAGGPKHCPTCRASREFYEFVARWGDA